MTPNITELFTACILGVLGFSILQTVITSGRLIAYGYRARYLSRGLLPQVRCPKPIRVLISFCGDLLAILLVFVLLTVYDCGVLGGRLRLVHLVCFAGGLIAARLAYRRFLRPCLSRILATATELLLLPLCLLLYPIRVLVRMICALCLRLLLLCRRKYVKIKRDQAIRRFTAYQLSMARVAFLPTELSTKST